MKGPQTKVKHCYHDGSRELTKACDELDIPHDLSTPHRSQTNAIAERAVSLHCKIRLANPDRGKDTIYGDHEAVTIETTPGRVRFNEIWPKCENESGKSLGFIKKQLQKNNSQILSGGLSKLLDLKAQSTHLIFLNN